MKKKKEEEGIEKEERVQAAIHAFGFSLLLFFFFASRFLEFTIRRRTELFYFFFFVRAAAASFSALTASWSAVALIEDAFPLSLSAPF